MSSPHSASPPPFSTGDDTRVRVAVRCRPRSSDEKLSGDAAAVSITARQEDGEGQVGSTVVLSSSNEEKSFSFDRCYSPAASQAQIFQELAEPIVDKALQGFNGTVFAYGQTGSGKTYTMMGEDDVSGIIPLVVTDLFSKMQARSSTSRKEAGGESKGGNGTQFLVTVSYLEIYNEVVKDLLNPTHKRLKIREHPDIGIYVEGLAELVVKTDTDVRKILDQGNRVRQVAETNMNRRSSRSHTCFTLNIEQKTLTADGETVLRAKLNLVDLAGSERPDKSGAAGKTLREGAAINKSLSALGNVIHALSKSAQGHVPYRNSKLTRLLQESLGGNSLTVMIATVAPTAMNYSETLSTLQFAERAKEVKNEARRNEDASTDSIIRELREEIHRLRVELQSAVKAAAEGKSNDGGANDEKLQTMEETIANLTRAKQQTWQEKERLSNLFYEERERNMESKEAIQQAMATIAEEGQEIMRKLKELQHEKDALSGDYKRSKLAFTSLKKVLQEDMQTYESQLTAYNAGDSSVKQDQLQAMYMSICERKRQLAQRRHEMLMCKKRMRANETALEQHNILAALSRRNSAEVAGATEGTIAATSGNKDEELLRELTEKRKGLAKELEDDKKKLELRKASLGSQREYELELDLIQANADKRSVQLEAAYLHKIHARAVSNVRREFKQQQRADQRHSLHMLREMCECFEDERRAMKSKHDEFVHSLTQAVVDIKRLARENESLRSQLRKAMSTGAD